LSQMQIAEVLLQRGGPFADTGRRFIQWALDDLKVYGQRVWDPQQQVFRSMITDGTELQWQEVTDRDGNYYATLTTVGPAEPDGLIFWSYAMAYRLGKDPAHWHMARELARALGFGELGEPDGRGRALATQSLDRALQRQTQGDDWRPVVHTLYALLELHESTGDAALLEAASRVGDALLAHQADTGLFPRPGRDFARTGDESPLAILHVAAALAGKRDQMPRPASDTSFFHARYLGELAPHQQRIAERGDERTMDNLVYYGR
jgi:pectate lyase